MDFRHLQPSKVSKQSSTDSEEESEDESSSDEEEKGPTKTPKKQVRISCFSFFSCPVPFLLPYLCLARRSNRL